ncbi:MAG: helix-hairpin-helix domain-containing protein [Bacteroidales bacterium]|nr:helix-hairpin-helix domain-containing protein [Bacteroidales bacterium]
MKRQGFSKEHKIGITAVICLLTGAVIAFAYMYLNGNKIVIIQKDDNAVYDKKNYGRYKKDTIKNAYKTKRYNIFNYYYAEGDSLSKKTRLQTDTLTDFNADGYRRMVKKSYGDTVLDLNLCDTLDLQMISGIGRVYSRRIYNYGKKLGGYVSVEQLKEVYGMSDSLYRNIVKHLSVGQYNVRKININSADIKEIAAHPYIDWYLAKEIIIYRNTNGAYTDADQLRYIHIMDEDTFNKIKPYVTVR